jgi:hypothetical protein
MAAKLKVDLEFIPFESSNARCGLQLQRDRQGELVVPMVVWLVANLRMHGDTLGVEREG